ncbi:MAG: AAA family ATPase, partial [Waddliaceae bacterium]
LLGVTMAAPIIGGSFLLIGVLSVIYPHIRPMPFHLPHAENWTKMFLQGKLGDLSLVKGRKEVLDAMANTLTKNEKGESKKHPLLIGKSGVGKTQTVQAFVQAIERGEYPELKGKKVFYINTPALFDKGDILSGGDPLKKIKEAMGRHSDRFILVFDEIHVACEKGKNALLGEKLKKMLDPHGGFPHVIGITTSGEFLTNNRENDAFVRRFNLINVENTDETVTQEILNHSFLRNGSTTFLEKGALQAIYKKTSRRSWTQPHTSLEVLTGCLARTSSTQTSPLANKVEGLKHRKRFLASQGASASLDFDDPEDPGTEIVRLREQIRSLKKELADEEKQLKHLFQTKEQIAKVKRETYRTVLKVAHISGSKLSRKNKRQLNAFLLMSRFLAPAMETYVRSEAKKFGVKVVLDEPLIDEVIQAQEEAEQKKDEALKKAKKEKEDADKTLTS